VLIDRGAKLGLPCTKQEKGCVITFNALWFGFKTVWDSRSCGTYVVGESEYRFGISSYYSPSTGSERCCSIGDMIIREHNFKFTFDDGLSLFDIGCNGTIMINIRDKQIVYNRSPSGIFEYFMMPGGYRAYTMDNLINQLNNSTEFQYVVTIGDPVVALANKVPLPHLLRFYLKQLNTLHPSHTRLLELLDERK
jgi:hypothetical protein